MAKYTIVNISESKLALSYNHLEILENAFEALNISFLNLDSSEEGITTVTFTKL